MSKIFEVYWALGEENATIPDPWPQDLATHINHTNPLTVDFNETTSSVYLAVIQLDFKLIKICNCAIELSSTTVCRWADNRFAICFAHNGAGSPVHKYCCNGLHPGYAVHTSSPVYYYIS
jgi:hypothetical protein